MNITVTQCRDNWTFGQITDGAFRYSFQIKRATERSSCGISGGRIIKLWLAHAIGYSTVALFERGWEKLPQRDPHIRVTEALIRRFN